MIILSKVLKESNQIKILAIRVAAKRTLDNALLLIRETMQSMEYTQTCSTIESCLVEKATIVKTRKNNLLVDFKDSIALLQLGRYVIARKHLIEYLVCVHFLKYLIRVSMDLDFFPT